MRVLRIGLFVLVAAVPVFAQARYVADEQVTVANTSIGLTAATINEGSGHPAAERAKCRLETAEIRYRINGSAPTTTVGKLLYVGEIIELDGNDILNRFRGIRTGSTSGVLACEYLTP